MRRWASPACSIGRVCPISGCSLPCSIHGCMACKLRPIRSWSLARALSHRPCAVRLFVLYRQGVSDFGMQFALFNPRLHGLQTAANQIVVLGQDAEPQAVRAKTFGHHDASVELLALSSRGAVDDDAPKGAAAAQAFGRMLTAQRSEEHTSELQSLRHLVCRLLLE